MFLVIFGCYGILNTQYGSVLNIQLFANVYFVVKSFIIIRIYL